jgi:hypothetical protein
MHIAQHVHSKHKDTRFPRRQSLLTPKRNIDMKIYKERHEIYLTRRNTGLRPIMLTISLLLVSLFFLLHFLRLPLRFQLECLLLDRINLVVNYRNLGFGPE